MENKYNSNYNWYQSGLTWLKQERNYIKDNIDIDNIYFKFEKAFSGICYTYVNKLDDIYKTDFLTSDDGLSVYNMYNEYEIVNYFYKNFYTIDFAIDYNINIKDKIEKIDGIKLKDNMTFLLINQTNKIENGLYYIVKDDLILSKFLDNSENSKFFKCSINLGKNAFKEYSLNSNSKIFPTTTEDKEFIQIDSYIIKHIINYDILDNNKDNKIHFTDYSLTRKLFLNTANYTNETTIDFSDYLYNNSGITIKYKDGIDINYTGLCTSSTTYNQSYNYYNILFSGNTTGITNDLFNNEIYDKTYILTNNNFLFNKNNDNFIEVDIYGYEIISGKTSWYEFNTGATSQWFYQSGITVNNWQYLASGRSTTTGYTLINGEWTAGGVINILNNIFNTKNIFSYGNLSALTFKDIIPENIYEDIYNPIYSRATKYYNVTNINYYNHAVNNSNYSNDLLRFFKKSPLKYFTEISNNNNYITFKPINTNTDIYFDYNECYLEYYSNNILINKQKLFNQNYKYLSYTLLDSYLSSITWIKQNGLNYDFTIYNIFDWNYNSNNEYYTIYPTIEDEKDYFRKWTYVDIRESYSGISYRCLIVDIDYTNNFLVIEKSDKIFTTIYSISTVYTIEDISHTLRANYFNYNDYYKINSNLYFYRKHEYHIRKRIYSAYSDILTTLDINSVFRNSITGIFYENEDSKYILKLYNVYNLVPNLYNITNDTKLTYKPIELYKIGKNKQLSIPLPLKKENIVEKVGTFDIILIDNLLYSEYITGGDDTLGSNVIINGGENII